MIASWRVLTREQNLLASKASQAQDSPLKPPSITPLKNDRTPPAAEIEDSARRAASMVI